MPGSKKKSYKRVSDGAGRRTDLNANIVKNAMIIIEWRRSWIRSMTQVVKVVNICWVDKKEVGSGGSNWIKRCKFVDGNKIVTVKPSKMT